MKNNRAFLEKLLDGAEVEWKTLDEVFHLKNGYTPSKGIKEYWENGSIPWFRMEDIRENGRVLNISLQKVSESAVKGGKLFPANSIILSTTATIGEHALVQVEHLSNQQLTNFSIKESFLKYLDIKFAFHYFFLIGNQIKKSANFSSLPIVSLKDLKKIQIPIPPLPVQTEIVKILDALTALTSELTSELILRRKQYEYYREKLLSEEELGKVGVQWKALGEIVPISRGKRLIRSQLKDNDQYPVYQNSLQPLGYYDHKNCRAYMTFVIAAGAAGEIGFSNVEFWAADDCYYFDCANKILHDKFLYYFLLSNKHLLTNQVRKASVPRLSRVSIEKIKIPIVSFKEQERIVAILDKFETLTHSITEGLPLAIEQSQKRYEYYRELLLNFHNP